MGLNISDLGREKFSNFINSRECGKERGLKQKIIDYILEKAKCKNIHKLSQRRIKKIEEKVGEMIEDSIELDLDDVKRKEFNKSNEFFDQHTHFDKYETQNEKNSIEIMEDLPKKHIHFDKYEPFKR